MEHAIGHDVYIHPLYLLRQSSGDPKEFSVGTDTNILKFDLPEILIPQINRWNRVLFIKSKA